MKRTTTILAALLMLAAACGGAETVSDDTEAEPAGAATTAAEQTTAEAPATAEDTPEGGDAEPTADDNQAATGDVPELPEPEVTAIEFGYSALEPHSFPIEYAKQLGLYEDYGLETFETFYMEGTGPSSQGLVAEQLHGIMSPGGPVLSAAVTGTPFVSVATTIAKMTDSLFSAEGIESGEDLRGQSVAISQFGGESHAVVLLALEELGLTAQDVTIVQVGGQSDRIAALLAGSVQAAPIDEARAQEMEEQGLNELVTLSETDLELARQGLVFTQEFAEQNPNTVLVILGGALQALQMMYDDPDAAIDGYMEWTQTTDREQAEIDIQAYLDAAPRDFRWERSGWEALKEVLVDVNPQVEAVDVESVYSFEYLDQLDEMGFSEAVGVPAS